MSDSAPRPPKTPAPGAGELPASGEGAWGLDLWSGAAWFSDWFYLRLQWPMKIKRHRLNDLKPYLPAGAWEALLLGIRDHLERQMPLELQLRVQLNDGHSEWWHIQGSTERNGGGQPVSLTGSMRDVSAERRRDASDAEP